MKPSYRQDERNGFACTYCHIIYAKCHYIFRYWWFSVRAACMLLKYAKIYIFQPSPRHHIPRGLPLTREPPAHQRFTTAYFDDFYLLLFSERTRRGIPLFAAGMMSVKSRAHGHHAMIMSDSAGFRYFAIGFTSDRNALAYALYPRLRYLCYFL